MTEAFSVFADALAVAVVLAVVGAVVGERSDEANGLREDAVVEEAEVPPTRQQVVEEDGTAHILKQPHLPT